MPVQPHLFDQPARDIANRRGRLPAARWGRPAYTAIRAPSVSFSIVSLINSPARLCRGVTFGYRFFGLLTRTFSSSITVTCAAVAPLSTALARRPGDISGWPRCTHETTPSASADPSHRPPAGRLLAGPALTPGFPPALAGRFRPFPDRTAFRTWDSPFFVFFDIAIYMIIHLSMRGHSHTEHRSVRRSHFYREYPFAQVSLLDQKQDPFCKVPRIVGTLAVPRPAGLH